MNQVEAVEKFLKWLKTCPFTCTISSMQGSFVHVKFFLKPTMSRDINEYGQAIDAELERENI